MERVVANFAGQVRRATLNGRDHLVAPLTMIVPGVLPGSQGPLYYPPEEISRDPAIWNHVPLTVGHPYQNGQPTSARRADVLNRQSIGVVLDARIENGKLRANGYFDIEATRRIEPRILEDLQRGRPIELSTGLFTDNHPAPMGASFNGRGYSHIARNYRPDHLAILVDQKGACSIQDGCGVLVNQLTLNGAGGWKTLQVGSNVGGVDADASWQPLGVHLVANACGESCCSEKSGQGKCSHCMAKNKKQPSASLDITPAKACKILEDGKVHGEPLTAKQRGMFGSLCGERTDNQLDTPWQPVGQPTLNVPGGPNCGVGGSGFKPGNTCGRGGMGASTRLPGISSSGGGATRPFVREAKAAVKADRAAQSRGPTPADVPAREAQAASSRAKQTGSRADHEAAAKSHENAADAYAAMAARGGPGQDEYLRAAHAHRRAAAGHRRNTLDWTPVSNWCNQYGGTTCKGGKSSATAGASTSQGGKASKAGAAPAPSAAPAGKKPKAPKTADEAAAAADKSRATAKKYADQAKSLPEGSYARKNAIRNMDRHLKQAEKYEAQAKKLGGTTAQKAAKAKAEAKQAAKEKKAQERYDAYKKKVELSKKREPKFLGVGKGKGQGDSWPSDAGLAFVGGSVALFS